jgi:hypothetical protein
MKRVMTVGLVLCALSAMPTNAPAHPAGAAMGTSAAMWELVCAIPDTDGCEAAERPSSAATTGTNAGISKNLHLLATLGKGELKNFTTDMAFWGSYAMVGNYDGFQIVDISNPSAPTRVSESRCPGSQNDISVFRNLIVTSTDSVRTDDGCASTAGNASLPSSWEGLRIWDWSNPAAPVYVKSVKTDCGSHTHTTIPDEANNRLIVYVSSYSPSATSLNCLPPHDKISVVEIPLDNPSGARVLSEPVLFPTGGQASTSGCHDITAYPAIGLAAGACMGEGILIDIRDPETPKVVATMTDPNFAFWHSATFSDDGDVVMFTDELGGGTAARCRETDAGNKGADAFYDISNPAAPVFKGYFKIQNLKTGRYQSSAENCVSHNGSLLPSKSGRDLMVQAWYQGGTSVIDFTDPAKPREIGFFDRGPVGTSTSQTGGHWSSYWYNGRIYGSEIARGLDVLNLSGALDDGGARVPYFNAQTQQPLP